MSIVEDNDIYKDTVNFTDNLLKKLAQNPNDPDLIWLLGDNLTKANKHAENVQLLQIQEPTEKPVETSLLGKFINSITDPFYPNDFSNNSPTEKYVNTIARYDPLTKHSKLLTDQGNIADDMISNITDSPFYLANNDLETWTLLIHGLIFANLTGKQDQFFGVVCSDKNLVYWNHKLENKKSAYSWVGYSDFRDHPVTEKEIDANIVGPVRFQRDETIAKATKKAVLLVNSETVAELITKIVQK